MRLVGGSWNYGRYLWFEHFANMANCHESECKESELESKRCICHSPLVVYVVRMLLKTVESSKQGQAGDISIDKDCNKIRSFRLHREALCTPSHCARNN